MLPLLSRINQQNNQLLPQSGPYHPFYHNFPLTSHPNHWLPWEYLSWAQNFPHLATNPVPSCKIEQSESIRHVIPHNSQNEQGKNLFPLKYTKEKCLQKTVDQDDAFNVQKKAMYLSRKKQLTQEEKGQLKRYRQMRVEGYQEKKLKRTFEKKIVYTTRKRVADRRIRYKGKFINEYQARQLLGLSGDDHSFDKLKDMMKLLKTQS